MRVRSFTDLHVLEKIKMIKEVGPPEEQDVGGSNDRVHTYDSVLSAEPANHR